MDGQPNKLPSFGKGLQLAPLLRATALKLHRTDRCAPASLNCTPAALTALVQISDPGTTARVFPSEAVYVCDRGFALRDDGAQTLHAGATTTSCQTTGAWSEPAPTCVETCDNAPCHHGDCDDAGHTRLFQCACPDTKPLSWSGDRCQYDIDECDTGNGQCDVISGTFLAPCLNTAGSYHCDNCSTAVFGETLPADDSRPMVSCCHAPEAGDHRVPCDDRLLRCDYSSVAVEQGCMGPADASKTQAAHTSQPVPSGEPVEIEVTTYDVNERFTTLARNGVTGSAGVSSELSLVIHGPSGLVCTASSSVCPPDHCKNGGACTPGIDGAPSCTCTSGHTGAQCNVRQDPCEGHKCEAGECVPGSGANYCCACPADKGGRYCDIDATALCNGTSVIETCCGGNCAGSRDVVHVCSSDCAAIAQPFLEYCDPNRESGSGTSEQLYQLVVESLHGLCAASECTQADPCSSSPCLNGGTC